MYQKVELIGRIGKTKFGAIPGSGTSVMNFSVATSKSKRNKETGEWDETTEWHQLVSFNKCAENLRDNYSLGELVRVEGELRTRKWLGKHGEDHYTTEIIVNDFPQKLPRYWAQNAQSGENSQQQMSQEDSYEEALPRF